jgi:hypothetical protein
MPYVSSPPRIKGDSLARGMPTTDIGKRLKKERKRKDRTALD